MCEEVSDKLAVDLVADCILDAHYSVPTFFAPP